MCERTTNGMRTKALGGPDKSVYTFMQCGGSSFCRGILRSPLIPPRLEGNIPGRLMTPRHPPADVFSFGRQISMLLSSMTAALAARPGVNCLLFMHAAITLWSGSDGSFICIAASEINKDCHLICKRG